MNIPHKIVNGEIVLLTEEEIKTLNDTNLEFELEQKRLADQKNDAETFNAISDNYKLVIAQDDGSCKILDVSREMLDEKLELKKGLYPQDYRLVPISDFPSELEEAWTDDFNTDTVDIHNEKARQIILEELRKQRITKFAELDTESLRALEDGDSEWLEDIKAQKKKLRDATNPLKELIIKKFNCPLTLETIKKLGILNV